MGIEPTSSAWKAEVLPLNYTRLRHSAHFTRSPKPAPGDKLPDTRRTALCMRRSRRCATLRTAKLSLPPRSPGPVTGRGTQFTLVEGGGFEPPKAEPSDLQSDPFGRSGTPPEKRRYCVETQGDCQPPPNTAEPAPACKNPPGSVLACRPAAGLPVAEEAQHSPQGPGPLLIPASGIRNRPYI